MKALLVAIVSGLFVIFVSSAVQQAPSLFRAGEPVVEAACTKIPLRTKSILPVHVWGYQVCIRSYDVWAGASIPSNEPLRVNTAGMVVGQWYPVSGPKVQIRQDKIEYFPVQLWNPEFKRAVVDLRILYGDDEKHPHSFDVDGVSVNLIRSRR